MGPVCPVRRDTDDGPAEPPRRIGPMRRGRLEYESDAELSDDAVAVDGQHAGIACRILGWHVEPDEDTVWTGIRPRTGMLVARYVGDDRRFLIEPGDVIALDETDYCRLCGQIGCGHGAAGRA